MVINSTSNGRKASQFTRVEELKGRDTLIGLRDPLDEPDANKRNILVPQGVLALYANTTLPQVRALLAEEDLLPGRLYVVSGRGAGKPPVAVRAATGAQLSAYADQVESNGTVTAGTYNATTDVFTAGVPGGGTGGTGGGITNGGRIPNITITALPQTVTLPAGALEVWLVAEYPATTPDGDQAIQVIDPDNLSISGGQLTISTDANLPAGTVVKGQYYVAATGGGGPVTGSAPADFAFAADDYPDGNFPLAQPGKVYSVLVKGVDGVVEPFEYPDDYTFTGTTLTILGLEAGDTITGWQAVALNSEGGSTFDGRVIADWAPGEQKNRALVRSGGKLYEVIIDRVNGTVAPGPTTLATYRPIEYDDTALAARVSATELGLAGLSSKFVVHALTGVVTGYATLQAAVTAAPSRATILAFADTVEELTITRDLFLQAHGHTIGSLNVAQAARVRVEANVNGYIKADASAEVRSFGNVTFSPPATGFACLLGFNGGKIYHRGDVTLNTAIAGCMAVSSRENNALIDVDGTVTVSNQGMAAFQQNASLVLRGRVVSKDLGVQVTNGNFDCYASIDTRTSTNATDGYPLKVTQNASFGSGHHALHVGTQLLGPAGLPSIKDGNPPVGGQYVQVAGGVAQSSAPESSINLVYLTLQPVASATPPPLASVRAQNSNADFAFVPIPLQTFQKLPLDQVARQVGNGWDATNSQYVIPTTGLWSIGGCAQLSPGQANPAGVFYLTLFANGVRNTDLFIISAPSVFASGTTVSIENFYSAGDTLDLRCYQTCGNSATLIVNQKTAFFSARLISA